MRSLAAYVMRARMNAITAASAFALLSFFLPPIGVVSTAVIALVTLRNGVGECTRVSLCAGLAVTVLGFLLFGNPLMALASVLLLWLPTALIAVILRATRQLALAFEVAALLGILGVAGWYWFIPNPDDLWRQSFDALFAPLLDQFESKHDAEQVQAGLAFISRVMVGIVVAASVLSMMLSLMLARSWQALLYNPGGFRDEFLGLKIHPGIAYLSLAIVAAAALGRGTVSDAAWNMSFISLILYLVAGLSVLHFVLSFRKAKHVFVTVMYVMLVLVPHIAFPVALIGYTDTWLNWRGRTAHPR